MGKKRKRKQKKRSVVCTKSSCVVTEREGFEPSMIKLSYRRSRSTPSTARTSSLFNFTDNSFSASGLVPFFGKKKTVKKQT